MKNGSGRFALRARSFLDDQKPRLHTFLRNPVPHNPRFARSEEMAKLDALAGVEGVELMVGPESAMTVVHKPTFYSPRNRIFKAQLHPAFCRKALFAAAVSG